MGNNITKEEIIKRKIQDSFVIKSREGETFKKICEDLSTQFYRFITKEPGFTSQYVSRGMREVLTEENREAIEEALVNIYLGFIGKNGNVLKDKYDNYVKDIIENSGDLDKLRKTILGNREMIRRMRRNSCWGFAK